MNLMKMINRKAIALEAMLGIGIVATSAIPAQAEVQGPNNLYTVTPCRILDTREAEWYSRLDPESSVSIDIYGDAIPLQGGNPWGCPEIPSDANGVFMNIIAVNPQGNANNDLGVKPYGASLSGTAMNYQPGIFALSNSVFSAVCPGDKSGCWFSLTLQNGAGASTDIVIDVTGFTLPR